MPSGFPLKSKRVTREENIPEGSSAAAVARFFEGSNTIVPNLGFFKALVSGFFDL